MPSKPKALAGDTRILHAQDGCDRRNVSAFEVSKMKLPTAGWNEVTDWTLRVSIERLANGGVSNLIGIRFCPWCGEELARRAVRIARRQKAKAEGESDG